MHRGRFLVVVAALQLVSSWSVEVSGGAVMMTSGPTCGENRNAPVLISRPTFATFAISTAALRTVILREAGSA